MRKATEDHVRKCDPCQRRKTTRNSIAPLGDVEHPTPLWNHVDWYHWPLRDNTATKYVPSHFHRPFYKIYRGLPNPRSNCWDMCPSLCNSNCYAARHRFKTGYRSRTGIHVNFLQETCKILGIRRVRTSSYHPESNGMIERWHRFLHAGLSQDIISTGTNWDTLVPFT